MLRKLNRFLLIHTFDQAYEAINYINLWFIATATTSPSLNKVYQYFFIRNIDKLIVSSQLCIAVTEIAIRTVRSDPIVPNGDTIPVYNHRVAHSSYVPENPRFCSILRDDWEWSS